MPERPLPRGYRAWISLFPAGHRTEYGHEMVEALEHRWHKRRVGRVGELIFAIGTAADMTWNAFLLRGTTIGRTNGEVMTPKRCKVTGKCQFRFCGESIPTSATSGSSQLGRSWNFFIRPT